MNGIHVEGTLTIYGQDNQSGRIVVSTNSNNAPAIGGEGANIVINGGNISFTTGEETGYQQLSDGIGGTDSHVTVNRGTVSDSARRTAIGGERSSVTINGGTFEGSEEDIVEIYGYGAEISIHKAPVRAGYTFDYWKGSEYHPDDAYTVTEDHTFVAQWKANTPPPDTPDTPGTPRYPRHRRKQSGCYNLPCPDAAGGLWRHLCRFPQKKDGRQGGIKEIDFSEGFTHFGIF